MKRITDTEKQMRSDLDALFPQCALLDATEVGCLLGFGLTQAKAWLKAYQVPYTVTSLPGASREHRKYRKTDIAKVLANNTFGGQL